MQLKVIKADGSVEEYLHTKVLGTFNNALSLVNEPDILAVEQFAEAVTYYLYQKKDIAFTSEKIHQMIYNILTAADYENAAHALNEHRLNRKLWRRRIEVIDGRQEDGSDQFGLVCRWDKTRIVNDLVREDRLDRQIARAIASAVEEKVLNIGVMRIRRSLIKQLVLADKATMLQAQEQLQIAAD